MTPKPIETRYAGCRFRSRLEARWAVFFDRMGIEWEYEPQGYDLDGRWYLPDFRLTDCGTWIEAKGSEDELDVDLMGKATLGLPRPHDGYPSLLLLGPIPDAPPGGFVGWGWIGLSAEAIPDEGTVVGDAHWSFTPTSFADHPIRRADTSSATNWSAGGPLLVPTGDMWTPVNAANVDLEPAAYRAARSARFEHGESG